MCLSCICLLAMHTLICVTFSLPPGVWGWLRFMLVALAGLFCLPFYTTFYTTNYNRIHVTFFIGGEEAWWRGGGGGRDKLGEIRISIPSENLGFLHPVCKKNQYNIRTDRQTDRQKNTIFLKSRLHDIRPVT